MVISQHITSYPVSQGTMINFVACVADAEKAGTPFEGRWVSDVSHEEVEEAFRDFEPAVKSLLKVSLRADSFMSPSTKHLFLSVSKTPRDGRFMQQTNYHYPLVTELP